MASVGKYPPIATSTSANNFYLVVNPLNPESDQYKISPWNINTF